MDLQLVITLANQAAPDGKIQTAIAKMIAEMQAAGEPEACIIDKLLRMILEGTTYGVWPE